MKRDVFPMEVVDEGVLVEIGSSEELNEDEFLTWDGVVLVRPGERLHGHSYKELAGQLTMKHEGPGDHESGSSQDVHGKTGPKRKRGPASSRTRVRDRGGRKDFDTFFPDGDPEVHEIAEEFLSERDMEGFSGRSVLRLSPERGRKIAEAYDAAQSDPDDPEVVEAYAAFREEIEEQYEALIQAGYRLEPWEKDGQPYRNSKEMRIDVAVEDHLWYFKTEGTESTVPNPLMPPQVNDKFRAIHDVFGHSHSGRQFGPRGETNAFLDHARMFSPEARRALATETIGQNAWFNFSKANEGKEIKDRSFAEQKAFLLPEELYTDLLRGAGVQKQDDPDAGDDYMACPQHWRHEHGDDPEQVAKHMGPGAHPSGSSQDVHGHGKGGGSRGFVRDPLREVGGDEWNRAKAAELADQSEKAIPEIQRILDAGLEAQAEVGSGGPISWDEIDHDVQQEIQELFVETHLPDELAFAENSWANESLPEEAEYMANENGLDVVQNAIPGFIEAVQDGDDPGLLRLDDDALSFEMLWDVNDAEPGVAASHLPWNEDHPAVKEIWAAGMTRPLEGFENTDVEARFQALWDKHYGDTYQSAYEDARESWIEQYVIDAEAPEWVTEQAEEVVLQAWDEWDDGQKFDWSKKHGFDEVGENTPLAEPENYRVFRNGADYETTKRVAAYLTTERVAEVFLDRDVEILMGPNDNDLIGINNTVDQMELARRKVDTIETILWGAWKESSTSEGGTALRAALADEFGSRTRLKDGDLTIVATRWANDNLPGGYEGLKAYTRAKWEVSQFLMSKAGVGEVSTYRAVLLPHSVFAVPDTLEELESNYEFWEHGKVTTKPGVIVLPQIPNPRAGAWTRATNLGIQRNAALSTTTDQSIANSWQGAGGVTLAGRTRVVMRVNAPRTAAFGLPVYGKNVYGEHEVVMTGTAWSWWDAWIGKAPPFESDWSVPRRDDS